MGSVWANDTLIDMFKARGLKMHLVSGYAKRSRSSGGFDTLKGVGVHNDAAGAASLASRINWATVTSPSRPIGNGTIERDGTVVVWAMGAVNTQGKGGPVHGSRGVIPLDSGNRYMWSWEANNRGDGVATWTNDQLDAYVIATSVVLEWASRHTPGAQLDGRDVWTHYGWTNPSNIYGPSRKVDPRGPGYRNFAQAGLRPGNKWDQDLFRGQVQADLLANYRKPSTAPPPVVTPPSKPPSVGFDPANGEYGLLPFDGNKPSIREGARWMYPRYAAGVLRNEMFKLMYAMGKGAASTACQRVPVDGTFGPQMTLAVKLVQEAMGLTVDGVIGPRQTWPLIDSMSDGELF